MADEVHTVKERTTHRYSATLKDEAGTAIGSGDIAAITLTLYDKATGTILNSRDAQDVKNANNVTISAGGALVWTMQPADNAIITSTTVFEQHVALFEFTYATTKQGHWEVLLLVENRTNVP